MASMSSSRSLLVTYIGGTSERRDYFNTREKNGKLYAKADFGKGMKLYPLEKRGEILTFAEDDDIATVVVKKRKSPGDRAERPPIKRTFSGKEQERLRKELLAEIVTRKKGCWIEEGGTVVCDDKSIYGGPFSHKDHLVCKEFIHIIHGEGRISDEQIAALLYLTVQVKGSINVRKQFPLNADCGVQRAQGEAEPEEEDKVRFMPPRTTHAYTTIDRSLKPLKESLETANKIPWKQRSLSIKQILQNHRNDVIRYYCDCLKSLKKWSSYRNNTNMNSISEEIGIYEEIIRHVGVILDVIHWFMEKIFCGDGPSETLIVDYVVKLCDMIVKIDKIEKANRRSSLAKAATAAASTLAGICAYASGSR